jgi:ribosomal protein S18 acetylase RimI-like enzyme
MNALSQKLRGWLKLIVTHEARVIIVAPVETGPAGRGVQADDASECVIVETPAQLESIAHEIPQAFSYAKLRKAVEWSFLVCVRRPAPGGAGKQIVGYRMCERAVFQSPGVRKRISPQFVFIHYVEVLPEYRGKRVAGKLREYLQEYARRRNVRWTCGLVSVTNQASLAAHLRADDGANPKAVGRIDSLHFFGGRFVLATPWWRIKKALDELAR